MDQPVTVFVKISSALYIDSRLQFLIKNTNKEKRIKRKREMFMKKENIWQFYQADQRDGQHSESL